MTGSGLLAVVETACQYERIKQLRADGADVRTVVATPELDYRAKREGIPTASIADWVDWNLLQAAGEENIDRIEALAEDYSALLRSEVPADYRSDWVSLLAFFHPLKGLADALLLRAMQVSGVLAANPDRAVLCFGHPDYAYQGLNLMDKPSWSLAGRILRIAALTEGRPLRDLEATPDDPSWSAPQAAPAATARLKTSRALARLQNIVARLASGRAAPTLFHTFHGEMGRDLIPACNAAFRGRCRPLSELVPWRERTAAEARLGGGLGTRLWQRATESDALRRHFRFCGLDLYSLAAPLLERITRHAMPRLVALAAAARDVHPPARSVIALGGMVDEHYVIARWAESSGIPVVSMRYSGFLGYTELPMHERYEFAHCDFQVCNGPGAAAAMRQPAPGSRWRPGVKRAQPVGLGQPWLEEVWIEQRRRESARPAARLMYVMSSLPGDNAYIGRVYPEDIAYARLQLRIGELLARYATVQVIVKPPLRGRYPQLKPPLLDYLAGASCRNIQVVSEVPLRDCLDRADAFLLDSLSTPLLYVLATRKPFIVYANPSIWSLYPLARRLLAQRGVVADSEAELLSATARLLADETHTPPHVVDDCFLMQFGLATDDGRAAIRCASFLRELAVNRPLADDVLRSFLRRCGVPDG
jgi:hypothetical protein